MKSQTSGNWRAKLFAVLITLLFIGASIFAPTLPGKDKHQQRPAAPLYWGAQIGDQLTGEKAPWDMTAVYKFERMVKKRVSLVSFSSPFLDCATSPCTPYTFPTTPLEALRSHGAIPFLSWSSSLNPEEANQRPVRLAKIIDGTFDPYIRKYAETARNWGHPFFLRFNWEMNGFWFPWSEGVNGNRRGEYVAAWRHVHDIFTSVGATNATWVWCPNVDFTRELLSLHSQYPGDDYVDWTCLDGFNWGKRTDRAGWQSFNQVFHETYRRVLRIAPDKPMIIGEVASNELGGSKPAWIRNMLHLVTSRYRKVRGLIWFDVMDRNTHWPLESSSRAAKAFARGIRRPAYRPNVFGDIDARPIQPPNGP
jgi:mannan endo-1,4-beta-mannosidase